MAASSVLHVAAIVALSSVLLPTGVNRVPPAVQTVSFSEAPVALDEPELIELLQPRTLHSGGRSVPLTVVSENPLSEPVVAFDPRVPQLVGPLVDDVDLREDVRLAAAVASRGAGQGTGDGVGDGQGSGAAGEFFPLDRPTGRFVFVVDASKSMNHKYPGPAKTRFGRVKVELWRTIYRMVPEQKFFVVFFNTRAIPMPATELRNGGTERQADLFQWTASVRADGQTDPHEALLLAMRLQPDIIYFLTDGEFNYKVVREVTQANFGGVTIHTLSLGDDTGAKFLEEIAEKNRGTYRHIAEEGDDYWVETTTSAATAPAADESGP